ncbi:MAG: polyribonucleotide nucleotidyltransferase [Candidatus Thermoplasmatota archaeon]|nr:polyribonucleotide nucleotidyltransferase [Candidatus Thermoplasmatota archaeon]
MTYKKFEMELSGKKLTIETGKLALQAGSSVTARIGDTLVLATVTMAKKPRANMDFFPLMVDYEERYFAGGKIKGPRFMKREGRPSGEAILIGRMIDRGLRPLFPNEIRNDIQVILLPLSLDEENRPDIVGMIAACTALHMSNIPFDGPIAGLRVGMVTGDLVINPTIEEQEYSELNLVVMGDKDRLTMVDCDAMEVDDETMKVAFKEAMKALEPLTSFIDDIRKEIGHEKLKVEDLAKPLELSDEDKEAIKKLKAASKPMLKKYLFNSPKGSKSERWDVLNKMEEELVEKNASKFVTGDRDEEASKEYLSKLLGNFFHDYIEEQVTLAILDSDQRVDGRTLDQIRPLSAEVSILPRTHGSGLFSRGETQILSVVTLGSPGDDLIIETMERNENKRYFHHYNFLPYSVGEVKPLRGAGRREIGHGALAEKALKPVLPLEDEFPYTIRVVSEVMGSNGSSSMASTCGSTLALMDAGVPLKRHVAGIAMGLASDGKRWKVLTDLQDLEDGAGGMDFKVTSTRNGLTGVQMDTKTRGLSSEIIEATFPQMRKAIDEVLTVLETAIPEPRKELSSYAPRIIQMMIDPEKIGEVIGPGGKVIRGLCSELGVDIDVNDDGIVTITSTDPVMAKEAEERIKGIVKVVEVGEVYRDVEVVRILPFGAMVEITPNTNALIHISDIDWERTPRVEDKLKIGQRVDVKVVRMERGKIDVSMKALKPRPEGFSESQSRDDRRSGPRDRDNQRNRNRPRPNFKRN